MNSQTQRLWDYVIKLPNVEVSATTLNKVAAGDGVYVSSFSRRASDVRKWAREIGGDFVLSRDERLNGARHTAYTYIPPKPACQHFWSIKTNGGLQECLWCRETRIS